MDIEQIRKSPLFAKLLADVNNMEEDLRVFNRRYRQFLERDDAAVATVLRCHLVVEHFLDTYLRAANPIILHWDEARLTFVQKLSLADNPLSSINMLMPGLKCLNKIRNRVAHQLQVEFNDMDIQPIRSFVSVWYGAAGKPVPDGMDLLEAFVLTASSWLYGTACMIERHTPKHGLTGLIDWYAPEDDT